MKLRTPVRLEIRGVRVGKGGTSENVWALLANVMAKLDYGKPDDDLAEEKTERRQRQERRETSITLRYSPTLANRLSAKCRAVVKPMPGMEEETYKVLGVALQPEGRARFIELRVEREVK